MPSALVKFSVVISEDLRLSISVFGRLLPSDHQLFKELPTTVGTFDTICKACTRLQEMTMCEGNKDDAFVNLVRIRGGVIKKNDIVSAYLDGNSNSVHHSKCHVLLSEGIGKCLPCINYRSTLRAMKCRMEKTTTSDSTSHKSHTNYRYLQPDEMMARMKNLQRAKRTAEKCVSRLNEKLHSIIDEHGIELEDEDASDMATLMKEMDGEANAKNHFQKVFWEQQKKYNKLSDKRQMRWHPLMIRFALNLKYLSTNAYRAVGNFLALPSRRTLCDYTHVTSVGAGVSQDMIQRMKKDMDFDSITSPEKIVGVMLDEMKVKSGLVFNRRSGRLVGFVDLGTIAGELEALQFSLTTASSKPDQV